MGKDRTSRVIVFVASMVSAIFTIIVFVCSITTNVIFIPDSYRKTVTNFIPQGWGFFTKSPRGKQYMLYEHGTDKVITFKSGSSDNYFGFSKKSRRLSIESERLLKLARIKKIKDSDGRVVINIKRDSNLFHYIKPGAYKIVESETVPILFVNKDYNSPRRTFIVNLTK